MLKFYFFIRCNFICVLFTQLQITGLFNDEQISELVSIGMSDIAPQMVETYQNEITAAVNEKATVMINAQLEGKTLEDLINLIGE